jgi:hypothetical protein
MYALNIFYPVGSTLSNFGQAISDAVEFAARHDVSDARRPLLARAIEWEADLATLEILASALRVSSGSTITLPAHRYEMLSRGRGWARKGQGQSASWGNRTDRGYEVTPGRWVVGATDGFSRKASDAWVVKSVSVGSETWLVAN